MSEKQMYFKVQFNDYDNFDQYKKNFINFIMRDAFVIVWYNDDSNYYSAYPDYIQYPSSYEEGHSDSVYFMNVTDYEYSGLVKSPYILSEYHYDIPITNVSLIPIIDGTENKDNTVTAELPDGQDYLDVYGVDYTSKYDFQLRTSSFGIKINDHIYGVHYKIGLFPFRFYSNGDISEELPSIDYLKEELIDTDDIGGSTIYIGCYSSGRIIISSKDITLFGRDSLPSRFITAISSNINDCYDGYMYFELCHDETGEVFSDYGILISNEVFLKQSENSEWELAPFQFRYELPLYVIDEHINDNKWVYSAFAPVK